MFEYYADVMAIEGRDFGMPAAIDIYSKLS